MNRRDFFAALPFFPLATILPPPPETNAPRIRGIPVLRLPDYLSLSERRSAEDVLARLRPGGTLVLPSTRDKHGDFEWQFEIFDGDPSQVRVERKP